MATEEIRMKAIRAIRDKIGTEEIIMALDSEGLLAEKPTEDCSGHRDQQKFIEEILKNAPEDWLDDVWDGAIALEYVHTLEHRVKSLGGHLLKYPEYLDEPGDEQAPGQQVLF